MVDCGKSVPYEKSRGHFKQRYESSRVGWEGHVMRVDGPGYSDEQSGGQKFEAKLLLQMNPRDIHP